MYLKQQRNPICVWKAAKQAELVIVIQKCAELALYISNCTIFFQIRLLSGTYMRPSLCFSVPVVKANKNALPGPSRNTSKRTLLAHYRYLDKTDGIPSRKIKSRLH